MRDIECSAHLLACYRWRRYVSFSSVQFSRSVVSNSLRPHRWHSTRLPCPWNSPVKNTGVGCQFLLQWWKWKVKVKPLSRVQLAATPGTAAPGSSIHGIFQARVLEWGAIAFSKYLVTSKWKKEVKESVPSTRSFIFVLEVTCRQSPILK